MLENGPSLPVMQLEGPWTAQTAGKDATALQDSLEQIRARLVSCPIPMDARADYEGTNHFEITDSSTRRPMDGDYFWLEADPVNAFRFYEEQGKRLGAVMDAACNYRRDIRFLLSIIDGLMAERTNEA